MTLSDRLMALILCGIAFWGTAIIASAEEKYSGDIIKLWPKDVASLDTKGMGTPKPDRGDGHIRLTDITKPSMRYFPALVKKGQEPVPAIILCPGGGYMHLVITKVSPIAEWLNDRGISVFILNYRTPKKRKDAYQDIQRAVRIVRSRAAAWNIDPERIGVMGSSAGGHLSARVSNGYDTPSYEAVDELDVASCKPDFTVLLYPAYMNKGEALSEEFTVSNEISPTLIITAKDDGFFPGSEIYAKALKEAGASIRVHFFEKGGHGFSLRPKEYPLSTWPDLCLQWLRDIKIIEEGAEQEKVERLQQLRERYQQARATFAETQDYRKDYRASRESAQQLVSALLNHWIALPEDAAEGPALGQEIRTFFKDLAGNPLTERSNIGKSFIARTVWPLLADLEPTPAQAAFMAELTKPQMGVRINDKLARVGIPTEALGWDVQAAYALALIRSGQDKQARDEITMLHDKVSINYARNPKGSLDYGVEAGAGRYRNYTDYLQLCQVLHALQDAISNNHEGARKRMEKARKLREDLSPEASPLVTEVSRRVKVDKK
jgi:acetyl esterase/lipase